MVMASDLYLGEGATLTTDQYGEVWAGSIAMNGGIPGNTGSNGTLSFQGNNVYVAGDLRMTGERNVFTAGAQIDGEYAGQYIGFVMERAWTAAPFWSTARIRRSI